MAATGEHWQGAAIQDLYVDLAALPPTKLQRAWHAAKALPWALSDEAFALRLLRRAPDVRLGDTLSILKQAIREPC